MTTLTTIRPVRAPWLRAARWQLRSQAAVGAWLWATMAVAATVVVGLLSRFADVEVSIFQFSRHGALWTGFAMAVIFCTAGLAAHVASGLTRAAFVRATVVVGVVVGVVYALLAGIGLELEGLVYGANGWSHVGSGGGVDPQHGFDPPSGLGVVPGLALSFVAGQLSGLLVGMAYYRLGGWWGTVVLPLTLAPIYLVGSPSLTTGQLQLLAPLDLSAPAAAIVSVAVLAAAALAYYLLARHVPIRSVQS
ncbi:hypothetical protein [Georgenia sp. SYP-B2076]|uniref:hypothetical protein n=1 Tax=Georgenia sp. SYP-B2076 TaxID=2495881 RepID=UPI000F8CEE39|nr:hypothetical protein [Georgenia sp. SYP-B2076]